MKKIENGGARAEEDYFGIKNKVRNFKDHQQSPGTSNKML